MSAYTISELRAKDSELQKLHTDVDPFRKRIKQLENFLKASKAEHRTMLHESELITQLQN